MEQPYKMQKKMSLAHKMRCYSLKRRDEGSLQYEAASLEMDALPDVAALQDDVVSQDEDILVLRLPPKMMLH